MSFNPLKSVKSAALSGVQKGINKSLGTSGSYAGNSIGGLLNSLSQSLFEVGNAFGTISAVTSLKVDSVVAGGDTSFVTGKCPERYAAGDLEAGNAPRGVRQSMKDHIMNTDPTGKIGKATNHKNGSNYYPLAWGSDRYYMTMRVFSYDRTKLFKKADDDPQYTVTLPLPTELADRQYANYSTANMQAVGTFVDEGMSAGLGAQLAMTAGISAVGSIAGAAVGALSKASPTFGKVAGVATSAAAAAGINTENITNAIEQRMGAAPNPQPAVLFKGPELREHSFTWTFNPRSADESRRIRQTIERLKSSALPRKAFTDSTGVMRYPHMCMLNFYPWDNTEPMESEIYQWGHGSIIRIKRCFISNITANYAPNGVPAFFASDKDTKKEDPGAPVFIQMSISLKEIEYFTSEDWYSVTDSYDFQAKFDESKSTIGTLAGGALPGTQTP